MISTNTFLDSFSLLALAKMGVEKGFPGPCFPEAGVGRKIQTFFAPHPHTMSKYATLPDIVSFSRL